MQPDGTGITERSYLLVEGRTAYVEQVGGDLPALPADLAGYDSRNAGLLIAAIEEIRESIDMALSRYGPARIAVVLGTSTSGIAEGEQAYFEALRTGSFPEGFDIRHIGRAHV